MAWENRSRKHIRDRETDVNEYLRQRHKELTDPQLYVALFDTERNEAAKKGWKEQVTDFISIIMCRSFFSLFEISNNEKN